MSAEALQNARRPLSERNQCLDFIKGALILLVLFGHSLQYFVYAGGDAYYDDYLFRLIYIFHMPLFMAVSGYVAAFRLQEKPLRTVAREKIMQFVVPMAFWCLLMAVLSVAGKHHLNLMRIPGLFADKFFNAYWFLWAVLFGYIAVRTLISLPIPPACSLPLSAAVLLLVPLESKIALMTRYTYPFFCAGFLLNQRTDIEAISKAGYGVLIAVASCAYFAWTPETYIYVNALAPRYWPQLIVMFAGAAAFSVLAYKVLELAYALLMGTALERALTRIGVFTLQIYLAQGLFFAAVRALNIPAIGGYGLRVSVAVVISVLLAWAVLLGCALTAPFKSLAAVMWGERRIPTPR